jgi:tripartite-type tricarboxylate transporter receptor subunit TctC
VDRFSRALNIEVVPVPYKGTADLVKGMLSGEIETAFDSSAPYTGHFESGRIRAFVTSGPSRSLALPDIPTLNELGVKDIDTQIWHGVSAPAGLPAAIRDKIQKDVSQALHDPEVRRKLLIAGLEPRPSTTAEYVKQIQQESARLAPVIKKLGIQLD